MVLGTITRRSLRSRWIRFLLCSLAVIVGVAFVTGSFVLSDSLRRVFDQLATTFTQDTDVSVRSVDAFAGSNSLDANRQPLPEAMVAAVAAVDGVASAEGSVGGSVTAIAPDGDVFKTGGAPVLGISWNGGETSAFRLEEGTAPHGRQVAVDAKAAKAYDVHVGDQLTVRAASDDTYQVSGIFDVGDGGAGAYYLTFDLPSTQRLFGYDGTVSSIEVRAADGVSQEVLRDRIATTLPDGVEAITGQQAQDEFAGSFDQVIGVFRNILLVFAFITLFVAAFLINTVFNTTVGQRVRELALLRAIGARNAQVRRLVLFESLAIGVFGSVTGALAGVGVAAMLKALISGSGGGLPDGPLVLSGFTWFMALVVGVGVTTVVSIIPAWRAGRVAPVAAMRDGHESFGGRATVRVVVSGVTLAAGLGAFMVGLLGDVGQLSQRLSLLGAGALLIFLGVTGVTPLFARQLAGAIGAPLAKLFGMSGRLAQGNAARNPKRTSSTAAALMIGVALVSTVGVLGASFKASFSKQLREGIAADYFVESKGDGFSPEYTRQVSELPGIASVATFRFGTVKIGEDTTELMAAPADGIGDVVNFSSLEGVASPLPDDAIMIEKQTAADHGYTVGSIVPVTFPLGGERDLRVVGIYGDPIGMDNYLINQDLYDQAFPPERRLDLFGGVTLDPNADRTATVASLQELTSHFPEVDLQDRTEFLASQTAQIDQLSTLVNGLLGMSLAVAVLGIAITLSLAVFERTREFGLLRAVGQQRRQTRRMVRLEAVIVALLGAGLGVALGVLFGTAMTSAMPNDIIAAIQVPWAQLVVTLIGAAIAGIGAALLPAWRASRLKVLQAIAYE